MPASSTSSSSARTIRGRLTRSFGRHGTTVLVAALTAMVVAAGPTVAATAVSLARNAMAVDGQSATKYTTSKTTRKNKLVATNKFGFLPNNIISKADNANKLDGLDSTAFLGASAKAADANTVDGLDSTAFLGATATATNSGLLDGLDSTAFLGASATATDSQLLDGLNSSDFVQASARVVYLQGDGTDSANGSALVSALGAISDSAASKQYLVLLEPGTYDIGTQELVLPAFVHLHGSGMTATLITGSGTVAGAGSACATSQYACVLQLNGMSEVRDVQVKNTGNSDNAYRIAVYSNASGATLRNVHAYATGTLFTTTGWRVGIMTHGTPPTILDSFLQVSNAYTNFALGTVDTNGQTMRVDGSRLLSIGAGNDYYGVYAGSTGPATGATTIHLTDSYVSADGVAADFDINDGDANSTVRVANTQLFNGDVTGSGNTVCTDSVYDATFVTVIAC